MDYIFYQAAAINGFDAVGHYLRAGLLVNQCATYAVDAGRGLLGEVPGHDGLGVRRGRRETSAIDAAGDDPVLRATAIALAQALGQEVEKARKQQATAAKQPSKAAASSSRSASRARGAGRPSRRRRSPRPPRPSTRPRRRRGVRADAPRPPPPPQRRRGRGDRAAAPAADRDARRPGRRAAGLPLRRGRRMRARGGGIASQPRADRRRDGAGRSSSPSSCPTTPTRACRSSRPTRSRPRSRAPRSSSSATTSRSAARAWARSRRSSRRTLRRRHRDRRARPDAGQGRRPAARSDSTLMVRPRSALGLKYVEITRGTSRETLPGRRHDRARAGQDAGRARRVPEHVRRGHARRLAGQPRGLRDRLRRPRRVDQHRDRRLPAAAARRHPGDARTSPTPETGLGTLVTELCDAAAIVAPAAETQASLFRNLDATMAALREVARPYIQDSIEGGKPALDAGIESLPRQRPFLANTEGLMRELQPGARALRTAAPELSARSATGIEVLPQHAAAQPPPGLAAAGGQGVRRRPAGPARHPATRPTLVNSLRPTLDYLAPDPDRLQLPDAVVPQHLLAAERGRPQRHLAAVHHRHHPAGPEQRGRPVVGAGQRPDGVQPPAHQPVPEHRRAGPAA